jgi:hypothetical protein
VWQKSESRIITEIRIYATFSRYEHNEMDSKRNQLEGIIDLVKSLAKVNGVTSQVFKMQ